MVTLPCLSAKTISHTHTGTPSAHLVLPTQLACRLWIVDDEGVEQVIDRSALPILKETPIGYRFYKELVHKLFPSQAMQLVCLELYTLYIGILPTAMVSKNDRALITMLHPQGDQ